MMVYIPGWGYSSKIFTTLSSFDKHSILLDLPDLKNVSLESVASSLVESIPNNTHLTGWSLGGLIAIKIAAMFPMKISHLTLYSTTPRFLAAKNWLGVSQLIADDFLSSAQVDLCSLMSKFTMLVDYPFRRISKNFTLCSTENKKNLMAYLKLLLNSDAREEYSKIKVPIEHIYGENDAVIVVDHNALQKLNTNSTVTIMEKNGHAFFLKENR